MTRRTAQGWIVLMAVLSGACAQLPPVVPADPVGDGGSFRSLERGIYEEVNRYRRSIGLHPLIEDPRLDEIAREHSENMARGAVPFGHEGFENRFVLARESLPITRLSENVGMNFNFPAPAVPNQVVSGWLRSPGHRENLSGFHEFTGVGVARSARGEYFATQIYAGR